MRATRTATCWTEIIRETLCPAPVRIRSCSVRRRTRTTARGHSNWITPARWGTARLEAGYKGSIDLLDSRFGVETFDHGLNAYLTDAHKTNTFDYRQNIQAAYGIMQQAFGPFATQVGLRYEQARTTFDLTTSSERYENDYYSFFPSAFLTWELARSETSWKQIKFSYSKRISRPRTWRLNPFNDSLDPYSRREGNPYLEPEYTHSMEGSYIHFAGPVSITLTPYYRKTINRIQWHEFINDQGVSITTFRNFDSSSSSGFESIGTLRLADRLNAFGSFNAFRVQTDGSNVESGLGNDAWGWSARGECHAQRSEGAVCAAFLFLPGAHGHRKRPHRFVFDGEHRGAPAVAE